jgi:hypothetical protein
VLLFYAATAGAGFLFAATLITSLINQYLGGLGAIWRDLVPLDHSGKAALALILGAVLWYPANWYFKDEEEIERVIQRRQDALEILLRTAMGERKLIAITVKSGKVYVGYITSNLNPAFTTMSLSMIPMLSGYRNSNDKTVSFTTQYTEVYESIENKALMEVLKVRQSEGLTDEEAKNLTRKIVDIELEDFQLVIPLAELQSATIFNMSIYNMYFSSDAASTPSK